MLPSMNAVSFLSNGSILPRKSGASVAPMSSPPAIPFEAPKQSQMSKTVTVKLGKLAAYLSHSYTEVSENDPESVKVTGMFVPTGVSLIVGGGYHGKSTLLRTIAAGVYDKIVGDGRELCVTVISAVNVRAEDGRYVNNCNISAFISDLPSLPGMNDEEIVIDTSSFSTKEASGSTSQAANVSEAIEMGASALLVDEDVSAANFMARDGRMRALVMDESITPLLYRVNGLYSELGISSVVVVGGVGDWLDVPDAVIQLNRYIAYDSLAKARSISKQFSYGHVQYAGRGVVHRLSWEKKLTPLQRRPTNSEIFFSTESSFISLPDGGGRVCIYERESDRNFINERVDHFVNSADDEGKGIIDLTRCEQLLGGKWQLYGCGLCVVWILRLSIQNPKMSINELLNKLDSVVDSGGMIEIIQQLCKDTDLVKLSILKSVGFIYRPRRYEVAMALVRLRGITFENMPADVGDEEAKAAKEAERRRKELAEMW
eukprot:CAMPEP_0184862590 /NCGR_PEP_ID=MMETSP0580-20130426/7035_1 /TAXON_ID=1118495 /ORGANISM="Dactyliosolen fragilissimus" /LENGTH=486 /DNA_ID=CAMNT_0027360527 /DNA_START=394 /DNA_END=1851 /DNA_ORIENTATION=+